MVSRDRLLEELWHGRPPATALAALQNAVSQLRKSLGSDTIVTHPGGYELRLRAGSFDVHRFERLVAEAREAAGERRNEHALALLDESLALWRGPALADFEFESFARAESDRLEELRLVALEDRIDAELALGRHADLVAALQALISEHPLRERLREQMMLALYRSGRQADALAAYRGARRLLVDELGVEPGPTLRELERRILGHDPALTLQASIAPGGNLPAPPTPIVGRAPELAALAKLMSDTRLITLTGPGGTGKTRLALEVAACLAPRFGDGAWFAELASVTDTRLVPARLEQVFGRVGDPEERLSEYLRPRRLLLVVDNLEHLESAASLLSRLLAEAPGLSVLATSRRALRLSGEHEYAVPPLALPTSDQVGDRERLAEVESVALFLARARAVDPGFSLTDANAAAVAEIAARLDGLPLAIELAAGWVKLLGVNSLLSRLEHRLDLLARGAVDLPERQRTLRRTVDWSFQLLLGGRERNLLAKLSVFAGGLTVDAAESLCSGADVLDDLASLLDKSLVTRVATPTGEPRLALLETIRDFALEQLGASGEEDQVRAAHAAWALGLAEAAEPELVGADQERWTARLDAESANLDAALSWGLERDPEVAVRLAGALWRFWYARGRLAEGRDWIARALACECSRRGRAKAVYGLACLAYYLGHTDDAERHWREAAALWRKLHNYVGFANALNNLGMIAHYRGDLDEAERQCRAALRSGHKAGNERAVVVSLSHLGSLANDRGDRAAARQLLEEANAGFRALGDERAMSDTLNSLAAVSLADSDLQRAEALGEESLTAFLRLEDSTGIIEALQGLGRVAAQRGDDERAARLLEDALGRSRESGNAWGAAFSLDELARLALRAGERDRARALAREALRLQRQLDHAAGVETSLATLAAADRLEPALP